MAYGPLFAPTGAFELPGWDRQSVVGEFYRQDALRRVAAKVFVPKASDNEWDLTPPFPAYLVPEPENPFDPHAVAVYFGAEHIGYLASGNAANYQPALLRLKARGLVGTCEGRMVMVDYQGSLGAYLHLSTPRDVEIAIDASANAVFVGGSRQYTLSGTPPFQKVLAEIHAGASAHHETVAALIPTTFLTGKHAGLTGVEVRIGGREIGALSRYAGDKYLPLITSVVSARKEAICRVMLAREEKKIDAYVYLRPLKT